MFYYTCFSSEGRAGNMKEVYVTLFLNPSPRERDYVASLRSMCLFVVFFYEGVDFQTVGLDACVLWGAGMGCK